MSKITTLSAVTAATKDKYWDDFIRIDKVIIEAHICPTCGKSLEYKGIANMAESRGYGVCEKCDYAKLFWTFPAPEADFKRKICDAVQKTA